MTTQTGNTIRKDVIMVFSENESGDSDAIDIADEAKKRIETRSSGSADYPPISWDGRYTVHGVAVYDVYYNSSYVAFYRPIGCYFSYEKFVSNVSVSYISVKYICDGIVYSYPGFVNQGYEEEFVIQASKSNPVANNLYSTTRNYTSGKALMTASGSPFVGNFLTFNITVNGQSDDYTVTL